MRHHSKIILSCLLFMLLMPLIVAPPAVHAVSVFEDGEYSLPFQVLQETRDEPSATSEYMESPATLTVEDGHMRITVTLKNSSWWQSFDILTPQGTYEAVTLISEDETNDTRRVAFDAYDLEAALQAHIHIIVTGIPGFVYDNTYDIRFTFDTSHIPVHTVTDPDASDETGQEDADVSEPSDTPSTADDEMTNAEPDRDVADAGTHEPESDAGSEAKTSGEHDVIDDNDTVAADELDTEVNHEVDLNGQVDLNTDHAPVQGTEQQAQDDAAELEQQQEESSSNSYVRTVLVITIASLCILAVIVLLLIRKRK